MLGVGLAAAVLIDATVVRGILLPAVLTALGERTWYLPQWLRRLLPDREPAVPAPAAGLSAAREKAGQLPAAR